MEFKKKKQKKIGKIQVDRRKESTIKKEKKDAIYGN